MTPSGRPAYCRTDSSGIGRPRNSLARRVRAMLRFFLSDTAASQPGGRLSPVRISTSRSGSRDITRTYGISSPLRTGTLDGKNQSLGNGALEEIRYVRAAGSPARCAAGRGRPAS